MVCIIASLIKEMGTKEPVIDTTGLRPPRFLRWPWFNTGVSNTRPARSVCAARDIIKTTHIIETEFETPWFNLTLFNLTGFLRSALSNLSPFATCGDEQIFLIFLN